MSVKREVRSEPHGLTVIVDSLPNIAGKVETSYLKGTETLPFNHHAARNHTTEGLPTLNCFQIQHLYQRSVGLFQITVLYFYKFTFCIFTNLNDVGDL